MHLGGTDNPDVAARVPNLRCLLAIVAPRDDVVSGGEVGGHLQHVDNVVPRELRTIELDGVEAVHVRQRGLELRAEADAVVAVGLVLAEGQRVEAARHGVARPLRAGREGALGGPPGGDLGAGAVVELDPLLVTDEAQGRALEALLGDPHAALGRQLAEPVGVAAAVVRGDAPAHLHGAAGGPDLRVLVAGEGPRVGAVAVAPERAALGIRVAHGAALGVAAVVAAGAEDGCRAGRAPRHLLLPRPVLVPAGALLRQHRGARRDRDLALEEGVVRVVLGDAALRRLDLTGRPLAAAAGVAHRGGVAQLRVGVLPRRRLRHGAMGRTKRGADQQQGCCSEHGDEGRRMRSRCRVASSQLEP
mmetsp:Transcript_91035/g.283631  ORF Transcript_91035/g.283631 Transcript_91035/m.283631 type:complete len:360 (-) Transcript_91035:16-1095(-)